MAFAGSLSEQASCLLRKVKILGNVDATPAQLPSTSQASSCQPVTISRTKLRQALFRSGTDRVPGSEASLDGPATCPPRGNTRQSAGHRWRATSSFTIRVRRISGTWRNFLLTSIPATRSIGSTVSRARRTPRRTYPQPPGQIYVGHDFGVPWRATKLEQQIGTLSRGMFLHIENVQPRRKHPSQPDGNAPTPGFSTTQYDRLALLYLMASMRAQTGLVPAFHAAIDQGLSDGHDDPQNFSLEDFDAALGRLSPL